MPDGEIVCGRPNVSIAASIAFLVRVVTCITLARLRTVRVCIPTAEHHNALVVLLRPAPTCVSGRDRAGFGFPPSCVDREGGTLQHCVVGAMASTDTTGNEKAMNDQL